MMINSFSRWKIPCSKFVFTVRFIWFYQNKDAIKHFLSSGYTRDCSYFGNRLCYNLKSGEAGSVLIHRFLLFFFTWCKSWATGFRREGKRCRHGSGRQRRDSSSIKLNKWKVELKKGSEYFVVHYEGNINFSISHGEEDYARGFSESPGIISDSEYILQAPRSGFLLWW